ncbi:MAG: alkaline phosphatase [Verrucomicrobiota bacterium]
MLLLIQGCDHVHHDDQEKGNVIFIHPDGYSLSAWHAYRVLHIGPDGNLAWDQLPYLSVYRAHVRNSLAPTSHAGGTIHAYGVKVGRNSFGLDEGASIQSASGYSGSLMMEAIESGIRCGIVNSGHLAEPGTAAMLARVKSRKNRTEVVSQVLSSGAKVILGGGEILFLPTGTVGRHGRPGIRDDNRNLIEEAIADGFTVVYTSEELAALPDDTDKVLGLFVAEDTYNTVSEEKLRSRGLPPYNEDAPDVGEMTREALRFLSYGDDQFFLMVEEEATDNFANQNNASGLFEAYARADRAIAEGRSFIAERDDTLLITAADSNASGVQLIALLGQGKDKLLKPDGTLMEAMANGAPVDGVDGTGTQPFQSAPDAAGQTFSFAVAWPTSRDLPGGVLARAEGFNGDLLPPNLDNTGIYRILYQTLFGREP